MLGVLPGSVLRNGWIFLTKKTIRKKRQKVEVFPTWGCPRSKEILCRTAGGWLAGLGWREMGRYGKERPWLKCLGPVGGDWIIGN